MKKTVRLTESALHRIVKESVKRILKESDEWLKFRNAAKKRYEQGKDELADRLADHATDRFNDEYGYDEFVDDYDEGGNQFRQDVKGRVYPNGNMNVGMGKWTPMYAQMHGGKYSREGDMSLINPRSNMKPTKNIVDKYRNAEAAMDRAVRESVKRVLKESTVPQYDQPVFIECSSEEDADVMVELGYSSYSSSRFFVGGCGTDGYAALEAIVQWLEENGLIDVYTYDEKDLESYAIEDFIEVEGYYIPSWNVCMEWLIDNHGGRRKFGESVRR